MSVLRPAIVAGAVAAVVVTAVAAGTAFDNDSPAADSNAAAPTCAAYAGLLVARDGGLSVADEDCGLRSIAPKDPDRLTPALSPDGRSIAFVRITQAADERPAVAELIVLDVATQDEIVVAKSETGYMYDPAWSPDGSAIAYAWDDRKDGRPAIWTLDLKSSEPTLINRGETAQSAPEWSPDGKQLLFVRSGDPSAIVVADAATGEELRNVTLDLSGKGYGFAALGAWSSDGSQLAVLYGEDNEAEPITYSITVLDKAGEVVARSEELADGVYVDSMTWRDEVLLVSTNQSTSAFDSELRVVGEAPFAAALN